MAKFQKTGQRPEELIETIESEQKKQDSYVLLDLFSDISNEVAEVWYPGIIGYGEYHYKYNSGHEGVATLIAFAPRKQRFSIYLELEFPEKEELLKSLGKYKLGVGCIYINKLSDINLDILKTMAKKSLEYTLSKYGKKE